MAVAGCRSSGRLRRAPTAEPISGHTAVMASPAVSVTGCAIAAPMLPAARPNGR